MKVKKTLSEQLKDERMKKFKYQQLDIKKNNKNVSEVDTNTDSLYHIAYNYRLNYNGNVSIDSEKILLSVSKKYDILIQDMKSNKRNADIIHSRHIAIFTMYHFLPLSLNKIGIIFGNRDHSTIRHAVFKVSDMIGIYPHIKNELLSILKKLKYIEG